MGIDLGTTYSCVAVWLDEHNRIEIIHNDQGNRTTPSFVSFTDDQRLIGDASKNQAASNPENTVFGNFCSLICFIPLILLKQLLQSCYEIFMLLRVAIKRHCCSLKCVCIMIKATSIIFRLSWSGTEQEIFVKRDGSN